MTKRINYPEHPGSTYEEPTYEDPVYQKEYVQKKLLELNKLFQNQTPPEKILSEFLPDIKASAYNVFKLLIDTYNNEREYHTNR